jgi:hypothetical protein
MPDIPRHLGQLASQSSRHFSTLAESRGPRSADWRCQLTEIWAANPSSARSTRKLPTALRPDRRRYDMLKYVVPLNDTPPIDIIAIT